MVGREATLVVGREATLVVYTLLPWWVYTFPPCIHPVPPWVYPACTPVYVSTAVHTISGSGVRDETWAQARRNPWVEGLPSG